MKEIWLSAQGDEARTVELAPSGFDVKSFPSQSRSRGCGIATEYKSTLGSNITFKANFDYILPSLTDLFRSSLASSHIASNQLLSHLFSERGFLITMI